MLWLTYIITYNRQEANKLYGFEPRFWEPKNFQKLTSINRNSVETKQPDCKGMRYKLEVPCTQCSMQRLVKDLGHA